MPPVVEEAVIILQQLGGKGFLLMIGASNLFAAGRNASNPNPWLRMDLPRNQSGANRFKVTLTPSDTYKVEFYHQKLVDCQAVISQQQVFDSVYGEDLPELFRSVTGFEPPCRPSRCQLAVLACPRPLPVDLAGTVGRIQPRLALRPRTPSCST